MTDESNVGGIQTGFRAEAHCWRCFKPNQEWCLFDGKKVLLCKGCQYELKSFSNWLMAYGLGIRQIPFPSDVRADPATPAADGAHAASDAPARVVAKKGGSKDLTNIIPHGEDEKGLLTP